jgi:hypothetical protein
MTSPPVPYVASAALVYGASAHVIDRLLARYLPLLLLPPWLMAEVESTRAAIRLAAREYEALPVAGSGTAVTAVAEFGPALLCEISTADAASLLGLSERRARQLGPLLGRRVGRAWLFDRDAVIDYRHASRRSA